MRRSLAITFICLLCSCAGTQTRSQDSPTWFSKEDYAIQLPADFSQDGNYKIEIHRTFKNSREEKLLRIAEATYPNRESILTVPHPFRLDDNIETVPEPLWWFSSFDGTRIPYAITAAAVQYYTDLSDKLRRGDQNCIFMETSKLEYRAGIEYHENLKYDNKTHRRVYVVKMKLDWNQYCGTECAMLFSKSRTVILDRSGMLLRIIGDGPEPVTVS